MNREDLPEHDAVELPDKLAADLKALVNSPTPISAEIDDKILAGARQHLLASGPLVGNKQRQSRRAGARWVAVGLGTAATLFISVGLWSLRPTGRPVTNQTAALPATENTESSSVVATLLREDIDGNGSVNILDAFLLARQLKQNRQQAGQTQRDQLNQRWDLNDDGKVDHLDVEHAALLAVKLKQDEPKG